MGKVVPEVKLYALIHLRVVSSTSPSVSRGSRNLWIRRVVFVDIGVVSVSNLSGGIHVVPFPDLGPSTRRYQTSEVKVPQNVLLWVTEPLGRLIRIVVIWMESTSGVS